ncbi:MAG: response regulator [Desulfobacteraceae bacterium]
MIELESMSILVVDDMKSMRLTIMKMLKHLKLGKDLKTASNCKDALSILKSNCVDLLILDWKLPHMSGSELLDHIRRDEELKYLPVIMVTAESEKDIVLEVAEIQVDGYLLKPLTLESLDSKIRSVVEKANNPDEATLCFRKAKELEKNGELKEAVRYIKLALAEKPNASRLLRTLGMLYVKSKDEREAEECFRKAVSVNPQDAEARYILGEMYHSKGELTKAARYHLDVLSLTGKYLEKSITLGEKLLKKGHRTPAIKLFSKIISRSERSMPAKERVVELCIENREFEYAKDILESMLKEFPSKYDLIMKAGYVYRELSDEDKALEYFRIVEKYQGHRIQPKLEIARILLEKEQVFEADEYLTRILRKDPENKEALSLRRLV